MDHEQKQIKEFMLAFNQQCPEKPCVPDLETRKLRAKLILEEALETVRALGIMPKHKTFDPWLSPDTLDEWEFQQCESQHTLKMSHIADACADLNYVTKGTAIACGLDMQPIFDEVHRSNMTKLWNAFQMSKVPSDAKMDCVFCKQPECGVLCLCDKAILGGSSYIVRTKEGKVIKSPSYSPANIEPIIEEQAK